MFHFISAITGRHSFSFQTETALVYDAVYLFAKALHVLDSSQTIDIRPLKCESNDAWQHGYSLINYMKMVIPFYLHNVVSNSLHYVFSTIILAHLLGINVKPS